jgi:hypothetical protein
MLYLHASAVIKRYFFEKGSSALNAGLERAETIYISSLSFAEVHAAMSRACRAKKLGGFGLTKIRAACESDWSIGLRALDVNVHTLTALPRLVGQYPLKAGDAIARSPAIWLEDTLRLRGRHTRSEGRVGFGVADRRLGEFAAECGLEVFNPEHKT